MKSIESTDSEMPNLTMSVQRFKDNRGDIYFVPNNFANVFILSSNDRKKLVEFLGDDDV